MISKEKLLSGYIDNQNKELQKEWCKACAYYGFNMEYFTRGVHHYKFSFIDNISYVDFCNDDYLQVVRKTELTLSDFKPKKTRTEWVKVEDSIFDLRPDFECGELYYKGPAGGYKQVVSIPFLAACLGGKNLYRKVEKEIDWRVEAKDYLDKCKHLTPMCDISLCIAEPKSDDKDDLKEWLELQKESIGLCHLVAELTEKP